MFNLKRHLRLHASKGEPQTDEQLQQSLAHGAAKAQAKCDKCGHVFRCIERLTQHQMSGCYYAALNVLRMSRLGAAKK